MATLNKVKVTINVDPRLLERITKFAIDQNLTGIDAAFEYAIEDLCGYEKD